MSPTSPRSIQIDPHLPSPSNNSSNLGRSMTGNSPLALSPSRALGGSMSGSAGMGRSLRPENPEARRERQRQQDIDSAKSMSRARSNSMAAAGQPSPDLPPALQSRPSHQHYQSTSPIDEGTFPMLSPNEEADMDRARARSFHADLDLEEGGLMDHHSYQGDHDGSRGSEHMEGDDGLHMHSSSHRRGSHHSDDHRSDERRSAHMLSGLQSRSQAPGGMGPIKNFFDFSHMDEFASKERQTLAQSGWKKDWEQDAQVPPMRSASDDALAGPNRVDDHRGSLEEARDEAGSSYGDRERGMSAYNDDGESALVTSPKTVSGDLDAPQQSFHRRRQRKLSQSNPAPHGRRQGKLALFEGIGALTGSGGENGTADEASPFKAARQPKNQLKSTPATAFNPYSDAPPGHDRPYRFSFYSNALPVTIHARSLAELPGEGQGFEDLFKGQEAAVAAATEGPSSFSDAGTRKGSGTATPRDIPSSLVDPKSLGKASMLAKAAGAGMNGAPGLPSEPGGGAQPPPATADDDPEAFTWWLDVLSPTDEEMRMLSKVFGIHPLTTEDILLEETREKIELFRNYYLVCFRSFDQDPYSQTYLEPLNMYIIVFREGTLSFHFRGTPHPQNVRRRIKHLKDYISVTSDWISYALIDDITDAFGPLIQSIEYEVDSIDELVLILKEAEQSDMLRRIGTCRKKVMGLLRLMGNKADVVKGLAKRCNEHWSQAPKSDIGLYLSDIQDHLITMTQNLNHYEKILSRSHSNYLAQISIEMTDANNQINDVLSKLTALGTVLIPMNLVTGLWGMNVHVPGQDIETGYTWFGGILGCLAAFAIVGAWATYKCFVVR